MYNSKIFIPVLITEIILDLLIAWFIGNKKRIGFFWTLFFGFFLTPIAALIFSLWSLPKGLKGDPKNDRFNPIFAIIVLICAIALTNDFYQLYSVKSIFDPTTFLSAIGFFGLSDYLFFRSKRNKALNATIQ